MHALAVNSVATLLNYLEEQLQHLKYSSSPSADESVSIRVVSTVSLYHWFILEVVSLCSCMVIN
jgi:hypothetical protein